MVQKRSWVYVLIPPGVLGVLILLGIAVPSVYYLNDDVAIRSILSGAYTGSPSGNIVYMSYPLTGLLALLYSRWSEIPWLGIMAAAGIFLAATGILIRGAALLGKTEGKEKTARSRLLFVALILLCLSLFPMHYLYAHYTVLAALLGGSGLFLLVTEKQSLKEAPRMNGLMLLLFLLCYLVRNQVFLLLLPFVLAALVWQAWNGRFRIFFPVLLTGLISILLCMIIDSQFYMTEEWEQYMSYNRSRSQLYDGYGILPYEEYKEAYRKLGVDKNTHEMLLHYNIGLDEEIDGELLERMADMSRDAGGGFLARDGWRASLREYREYIRNQSEYYRYAVAGLYILLAVGTLWKKKIGQLLLMGCILMGRSLIWVSLIRSGKLTEAISWSLYLIEIWVLAGMVLSLATQGGEKKKARETFSLVTALLICAGLLVLVPLELFQGISLVEKSRLKREEWVILREYFEEHRENTYLLDVYSMEGYTGEVWEAGSGFENYLLAGGWMGGTPFFRERMRALGAADGGEALVSGKEVFFVINASQDTGWLGAYMGRRFGGCSLIVEERLVIGDEVYYIYRVALTPFKEKEIKTVQINEC